MKEEDDVTPSTPSSRETLVGFFNDISTLKGEFLVQETGFRTRTFRYDEVAAMAHACRRRLREHSIGRGAAVLVWSENRAGWLAVLWACVLEGVTLVPVDYRASADYLLRIAKLVEARALAFGEEVSPPEDFPAVLWPLPEIEQHFDSPPDAPAPVAPDDIVQVVFTSGATAEPKGVTITHRNLLANMVPVEREINKYKWYGRPFFPLRFLNLLPLSHLFGQAMAAYIPPMLEGIVLFMPSLNPGVIMTRIRSQRVSVLVSVPKILEVLRDHVIARFPEAASPAADNTRWWWRWWLYRRVHRAFGFKFWAFVVGAAPLDPELEAFWSRLGFVVIQGYGLTETAPVVTLNHPFHARRGSVGKPISGVEVRIAPDGEILVRGPNVTGGYYRNAEANAQVFQDGWLHTGDLGEIASDGSLVVLGRKKDMIVTGAGLNVYPEDVERVLERIPGVREAAVVGPDRVNAVLVLEPGTDQEEVVCQANPQLEEHQRVRSVRVWQGDSLPRTEGTAKLKRAEIRQWVTGGEAPAVKSQSTGFMEALQRLAPGRTITPDTTLEELGLSSLERVELMGEMERHLGGPIDESAIGGSSRVSELAAARPQPVEPREEFPRWNRSSAARLVRRVLQPGLMLPLMRCFVSLKVRGLENLSRINSPVIFAANHQSHFDTPVILGALPARLRYRLSPAMSKDFFRAHFHPSGYSTGERMTKGLQYYLTALCFNAFPLPQRESGAGSALRYAGELASEGWSILIFPEGRRTDTGALYPFQPGVAMMASRLGLPVVPVRLRGVDKVLHTSARWPTRGPVEVSFGAPMQLSGDNWRELTHQVETAVAQL